MSTATISARIDDPMNAAILAISEDRTHGFSPDPFGDIASEGEVPAGALEAEVVRLCSLEWQVLMPLKREFTPEEIERDLWTARAEEAGVDLDMFVRVARELNRRKVIGRFSTFLEHV